MHPEFVTLFGRTIYWYGVMTAAGFLAAVAHWSRLARREGRDPGIGSELGLWVMVSGILGARVAYVLMFAQEFDGRLLEVVRIDKGGLVWYGGFLGAVAGIVLLARLKRESILTLGDFVITGVPLGHAFGRMGCFLNGCCFGGTCHLPWAVDFGHGPVHPTQLYAIGYNLLIYGALLAYYRRPGRRPGTTLALYLTLYPACRFFVQFLRADYPRGWVGLDSAQYMSLVLLLVTAAMWALLPKSRAAPNG
jgi:phosphatidylglycerol:prolipoprotein diacylglycerol transferase